MKFTNKYSRISSIEEFIDSERANFNLTFLFYLRQLGFNIRSVIGDSDECFISIFDGLVDKFLKILRENNIRYKLIDRSSYTTISISLENAKKLIGDYKSLPLFRSLYKEYKFLKSFLIKLNNSWDVGAIFLMTYNQLYEFGWVGLIKDVYINSGLLDYIIEEGFYYLKSSGELYIYVKK